MEELNLRSVTSPDEVLKKICQLDHKKLNLWFLPQNREREDRGSVTWNIKKSKIQVQVWVLFLPGDVAGMENLEFLRVENLGAGMGRGQS